jgi:hypothetical protein
MHREEATVASRIVGGLSLKATRLSILASLATIIPKQGALSLSAYEPGAFILAFGETASLPSPNATRKAPS